MLIKFVNSIFVQNQPYFELFENEAIGHIWMAIRHPETRCGNSALASMYIYYYIFRQPKWRLQAFQQFVESILDPIV